MYRHGRCRELSHLRSDIFNKYYQHTDKTHIVLRDVIARARRQLVSKVTLITRGPTALFPCKLFSRSEVAISWQCHTDVLLAPGRKL